MNYFKKMKGDAKSPLQVNVKDLFTAFVGSFLTIILLLELTEMTETPWFMASFGSSCILVFASWNAPLAQPRNIVGGHVISGFVGWGVAGLVGTTPMTLALAVAVAVVFTMALRVTHPPAIANALIVMIGGYHFEYLFTPILLGSSLVVVMGLLINNMRRTRRYPVFW